jgi:streptogramin lyase
VGDESGGRSLAHLDPETGALVGTVPVQVEPGTREVAVGDGTVWVVGGAALTLGPRTFVTRVDPARDEVLSRIELPGIEGKGVAVGEGAVWALGDRGRVTKVDPATGRAERTIVVGARTSAIAAAEGAVWVLAEVGLDLTLVRIDPATMEVVDQLALPGSGLEGSGVAVGEGAVWVLDVSSSSVRRVDILGNGLDLGVLYPTGSDPADITVAFGSVWVVNEGDGTVSRINPARYFAGKTPETIKVGGRPTGIAADEENGTIWVVRT